MGRTAFGVFTDELKGGSDMKALRFLILTIVALALVPWAAHLRMMRQGQKPGAGGDDAALPLGG
jgi:hypothetical protein